MHALGLRMVALACAQRGVRCQVLGTDTPIVQIERAARELDASAVVVSVSLATGGVETDRMLHDLRALLPSTVELVIGGRGARGVRRGPRGVLILEDFAALDSWLRDFGS